MNVNITHAGVCAHANGHVSVSFSTAEYDQKRAAKGLGFYPEHIVYLTLTEARHAIWCLKGDASFLPYFNDGIHMIMFHPQGVRIRDLDGGVSRKIYKSPTDEGPDEYEHGSFCRESYLSFPGREFAFFLNMAYVNAARFKVDADRAEAENKDRGWIPADESRRNYDRMHYIRNRTWKHNVQPTTIAKWKKDYGPKIQVVFERDADKYYMAALHDQRVPTPDPRKRSTLKDQMQSLARIARNYSDGDPVTVYVSPDDMPSENRPMSFYWHIQKGGRRISNGGIIAHANHAKTESGEYEQDGTFEYSIHT